MQETFDVTDDVSDTFSLVINEIYAIPQQDYTGDATVNNDDEFLEIINTTASAIDLTGYTIEDAFSLVHTFRDGTILEPGCAILVFSGGDGTLEEGSQAGVFGTAEVQIVSERTTLRITDTGDTMKLFNDLGDEVYLVDVPDLTGTPGDGSYVLSTDGVPASGYVQHVSINLTDSSPGTTALGTNYCTTTAQLTVSLSPSSVAENAGASAVTATVSIPGTLGVDLEVFVYSKDTGELEVPFGDLLGLGTITAGALSTTIDLDAVDDSEADGTQVVTVVGGASGYLNGTDTVDVTDDGDAATFTDLVINEVDADTPESGDSGEFIELYNKTGSVQSLDGLVLVLINGNGDTVYDAVDLTGQTIPANGFFVVGDVGTIDTNEGIQNGADAVALYVGSPSDFSSDPAVSTITNTLVDAVVYDTNDSDDTALIAELTPGMPQVSEGSSNNTDSNSRVPDGGAAFDTGLFVAQTPTPGATNVLAVGDIVVDSIARTGTSVEINFTSSGNVDVYKSTDLVDFTTLGTPYASNQASPYTDASATESAAFYILVPTGQTFP